MKTIIYRNSPDTFVMVTTNEEGKEFSREIRKSNSTDYSNCCNAFHRNNVAIQVGNKVNA